MTLSEDRYDYAVSTTAKWLSFVRLFCYVRTPACIYSYVANDSSFKTSKGVHNISLPSAISNLLVDIINERQAREAVIAAPEPSVTEPMLRDLLVSNGVIYEAPNVNSAFKPVLNAFVISRSSPILLGATLIELVRRALCLESRAEVAEAFAKTFEDLSLGHVVPAALWPCEVQWLAQQGHSWHGSVIADSCEDPTASFGKSTVCFDLNAVVKIPDNEDAVKIITKNW